MSMSNGVTGGIFATLVDLQASKARVNTRVELNGTRYSVDETNFGNGLAVNSLFANPIKGTTTSLLNSTLTPSQGDVRETIGFYSNGDNGGAKWQATGNVVAASQSPSSTGGGTISDANGNEYRLLNLECSPEMFGALPLGDSQGSACQAFLNHVSNTHTKGKLNGIYPTNQGLEVGTDCWVEGVGLQHSGFRAEDNAQLEFVLQTTGYNISENDWNYYPDNALSDYPNYDIAGSPIIKMGLSLGNFVVDGNYRNGGMKTFLVENTAWAALRLYVGKCRIDDIGVIDSGAHGIITEAGVPNNSVNPAYSDVWHYINMHESIFTNIYIDHCLLRGWRFRGPNDSYIDRVQIKQCGGSGFVQEIDGVSFASGGLKVGTIHTYLNNTDQSNTDIYSVEFRNDAKADHLFIDNAQKGGLNVDYKGFTANYVKFLNYHRAQNSTTQYALRMGEDNGQISKVRLEEGAQNTGASMPPVIAMLGNGNEITSAKLKFNSSSTVWASQAVLIGDSPNGNNSTINATIEDFAGTRCVRGNASYINCYLKTVNCSADGFNYENSGDEGLDLHVTYGGTGAAISSTGGIDPLKNNVVNVLSN